MSTGVVVVTVQLEQSGAQAEEDQGKYHFFWLDIGELVPGTTVPRTFVSMDMDNSPMESKCPLDNNLMDSHAFEFFVSQSIRTTVSWTTVSRSTIHCIRSL